MGYNKRKRCNGKGGVSKRANGYYQANWSYGGKRYKRNTGCKSYDKALEKLEEFMKPFQEKTEVEVLLNLEARVKAAQMKVEATEKQSAGILIDDVIKRYLSDVAFVDVTKTTRRAYRLHLNPLIKWLKSVHPEVKELKDVTTRMAKEYLTKIARETAPESYNIRLFTYKRVFTILGAEAGCTINPFENEKKRKPDKSRGHRSFTKEEVRRIFEACETPDDRMIFGLGLFAGLRISDACMIRHENLDLEKNLIRIKPMKVRKHLKEPLEIPICKRLRELIDAVLANGVKSEYVSKKWSSLYRGCRYTKRVKDIFKKVGIEVSTHVDGLKRIVTGSHSMRKTFVDWAINEAKMNPLLVMRIVGHSTISMTDHYYSVNEKVLREGFDHLDDVMQTAEHGPDSHVEQKVA